MYVIEHYWYVWAISTIACIVIAFARQLSMIKNIDRESDLMSGIGITMTFAFAGWVFAIVTVISIVLNIISYVK